MRILSRHLRIVITASILAIRILLRMTLEIGLPCDRLFAEAKQKPTVSKQKSAAARPFHHICHDTQGESNQCKDIREINTA